MMHVGDILSTWGMLSSMGDIVINVGRYLEYRGGYREYCGGYLEYCGDIQYHGDIMSTVGVFSILEDTILCNLSTMGDIMIHVGGA